jgi:IclR family KDG regulon transcriptional repressor
METTVVKALRLLEILALEEDATTLTVIADRCGITKSNAHRLLRTLERSSYVRQDPDRRTYSPTLKLWELGVRVFERVDIKAAAARHLITLARATNESVHLSVLDGREVIYIDKVDCTHAVRAYISIGERAPAFCTATGRAILSFLPPQIAIAACTGLKKFTARTIADQRSLRAEFDAVRKRGYSITRGEWREGVTGLGAPIRSSSGGVVAGIGIAGPTERLRNADLDALGRAVMFAADAISNGLGLATGTSDAGNDEQAGATIMKKPQYSQRRSRS